MPWQAFLTDTFSFINKVSYWNCVNAKGLINYDK